MQTLFNEKKKIINKNDHLINIFFTNMILITILSMKIIPFISIEVIVNIIIPLFILEGIIVQKVKNNEAKIREINGEIEKIKQNFLKQEVKYEDKILFLQEKELTDCLAQDKKLIKVKKRI